MDRHLCSAFTGPGRPGSESGYFCPTPRKGKIADIDTISPLASGVATVPVWFVLSWSSGIIDQHEKTIIHSQNPSFCEVIEKRIRELFVRMENLNVQSRFVTFRAMWRAFFRAN
jgi:hypothetical protein